MRILFVQGVNNLNAVVVDFEKKTIETPEYAEKENEWWDMELHLDTEISFNTMVNELLRAQHFIDKDVESED